MEDVFYDPGRCLTFWFRLVQSPHLKWPLSAGVRVERLDSTPRIDGGTLTFPQEIRWLAVPVPREDNVFEIKAAIPVPIVSHDQVLFVTLRDLLDRVVARVHVTYADARDLRHCGFSQWYPAEPAPLVGNVEHGDKPQQTALNELAKEERTTFRLVRYIDHGDLYASPLDSNPSAHPCRALTSHDVDRECFEWAAAVACDDHSQILLAGAFRLPVQAILFDMDEDKSETTNRTVHDLENGTYLAGILLDTTIVTTDDILFVACEYASGNMCALEVPSLADDDDYTRLAFPDGSDSVHRTAIDMTGARVAVLRRLNRPDWHPAVIMTISSGRRFVEAGLVMMPGTVVILSKRRCSAILLVAWRMPSIHDATGVEIYTRWQSRWKRKTVSSHSEIWKLKPSSFSIPPHVYRCDQTKWSDVFLPALLATTPRRLSPRLYDGAINEISRAVSNRRARGESGGYVPLGYHSVKERREATAVAIQRGFLNAVIPGLPAARQARNEEWRYTAFW